MSQKFFLFNLLVFSSFKIFAQLNPALDVQHYCFAIQLNDSNNIIKAEAQIGIKFLQDVNDVKLDLVQKRPDGKGMSLVNVKQNGRDVSFVQDSQHVVINAVAKK